MQPFENTELKIVALNWEPGETARNLFARARPQYAPNKWIDPERIARRLKRQMTPPRHSRNKFLYSTPKAAAAFVQGAGKPETTAASTTLSFGSNNTAGNMLVLVWRDLYTSATGGQAVSDSQGNTWVQAFATPRSSGGSGGYDDQWFVYYAPNCKPGANTVTVASTSATVKEYYIGEYSGLDPNLPLDAICYSTNVTGSGGLSMAIATAASAGLLVSAAWARGPAGGLPAAQSSSGWSSSRYNDTTSFNVWDQVTSSAATYTNNATCTNTTGQFNGVIVAFRTAVPTHGLLQSAVTTASSITSLAKAYQANNTAGNCLVAVVGLTSSQTPTISDSQSNTWYKATHATDGARGLTVFFAPNCVAGANTVTASFPSTTGSLEILEYAGVVSAHALDQAYSSAPGGSPSSFTGTIYAGTSDEIVLAALLQTNQTTLSEAYTSSGYSQRAFIGVNGGLTSFDSLQPSGGSISNTVTMATSANSVYALLGLRTALPSVGYLQATQVAGSSVGFVEPNSAGSLLVAVTANPGSTPSIPTDTNGNTWVPVPVQFSQEANQGSVFYALNCGAGANTVTATSATQLMIFEFTGLSTINALMGASGFDSFSGTTATSGTVNTAGTALLFSCVFDFSGTGRTFTATSGYNPIISQNASSPCMATWSQVVSSPGAQANTVTASGSITDAGVGIIAFSTASVSVPTLRQCCWAGSNAGADGTETCTFLNNVVAGNLIVACFANQSGTNSGNVSDTQGNTYTLIYGGAGNPYGLWYAIAGSSASLAVSNSVSNCGGAYEIENLKSASVDQKNTTSNTGTTVGTGGITTTKQPEIVMAFGFVNAKVTVDSISSGWAGANIPAGHLSTIGMAYQANAQIGSYSPTFTFNASQANVGVIVSFNGSGHTAFPQMQVAC